MAWNLKNEEVILFPSIPSTSSNRESSGRDGGKGKGKEITSITVGKTIEIHGVKISSPVGLGSRQTPPLIWLGGQSHDLMAA